MITIKSTLKVEIEYGSERATLVFRKPKLNDIFKQSSEEKGLADDNERLQYQFRNIFDSLVEIQDVCDDSGAPVTVETLKNMELPHDFIVAVVAAYRMAAFPRVEDPKKENSAPA